MTTTITADEIQRGRSILAYFNTIPWCSTLLNAPNTMILHQAPRQNTPGSTTEDAFWTRTLGTPDTVRGVLSVISSDLAAGYPRVKSCVTLFSLGPGLVGHDGMCHGGMISTLLDEGTGTLINLIEEIERKRDDTYAKKTPFTLNTETKYIKAVPAPGVVLIRSVLEQVDGKKRLVLGIVEDGKGNVLCEARYNFLLLDRGRTNDHMAKL